MIRLVVFLALMGAALVLDAYSERNLSDFDTIQAGAEEHNSEQHGEVYILAQSSSFTVKTSIQKTPIRNAQVEKHTKLLRNYCSIRNKQVLKAEVIKQTTPLIASYHFLVYQTHFYSLGEDPLS